MKRIHQGQTAYIDIKVLQKKMSRAVRGGLLGDSHGSHHGHHEDNEPNSINAILSSGSSQASLKAAASKQGYPREGYPKEESRIDCSNPFYTVLPECAPPTTTRPPCFPGDPRCPTTTTTTTTTTTRPPTQPVVQETTPNLEYLPPVDYLPPVSPDSSNLGALFLQPVVAEVEPTTTTTTRKTPTTAKNKEDFDCSHPFHAFLCGESPKKKKKKIIKVKSTTARAITTTELPTQPPCLPGEVGPQCPEANPSIDVRVFEKRPTTTTTVSTTTTRATTTELPVTTKALCFPGSSDPDCPIVCDETFADSRCPTTTVRPTSTVALVTTSLPKAIVKKLVKVPVAPKVVPSGENDPNHPFHSFLLQKPKNRKVKVKKISFLKNPLSQEASAASSSSAQIVEAPNNRRFRASDSLSPLPGFFESTRIKSRRGNAETL
ncbi:hypothetical protein QYM36_004219 [Artemia franciscana]|uniref:Uncharacterized protein n=1 Tax=Artemia franciscana TaxID=6661 RepID=A0AA88I5H2_ARTSF|nr:hypothetical protein QYM36_004219 [Artemia franciscana]